MNTNQFSRLLAAGSYPQYLVILSLIKLFRSKMT